MQSLGKPEPKMTRDSVDVIMAIAEEGDILLSYESMRFTSLFIKGKYDHAVILSSKKTIVEAVKPVVQEVDFEEWLFKKDKVILLRPRAEKYTRQLAGANALSFKDYKYDYSFSLSDKRVYCSELVYLCYAMESKNIFNSLNRNNILPIDFINLCDVVYEFKG
jgi:uncharacterized protein YycO